MLFIPCTSMPNFLIENIFHPLLPVPFQSFWFHVLFYDWRILLVLVPNFFGPEKQSESIFYTKQYTNYDCKKKTTLKNTFRIFYPNQKNTWLKQKGSKIIFFLKSSVIFATNLMLVQFLSDRKRNDACFKFRQLCPFYTIT